MVEGGLVPPGGLDCFSAGFLPARHQGSILRPRGEAIADATPRDPETVQQRKRQLIGRQDSAFAQETGSEAIACPNPNQEPDSRRHAGVPDFPGLVG